MHKNIFFALLFFNSLIYSQDYVDIFSVNYTHSNPISFENSLDKTAISNLETSFTLPIILNDKYAFISGFDFESNQLKLFPYSTNSLQSARIKAGIRIKYSEKWSGTFLILPKIASDFKNISTKDLFFGSLFLLKYHKQKNLNYKYGIYISNEAYGFFMTPIIGLYYKSPNARFELNLTLPTDLDLNYRIINSTKMGIIYTAFGKSFNITTNTNQSTYVENNSFQFSTYFQNNSLNKNIYMRLKFGIQTNDYSVYPIDQKIDFRISAIKLGDNRTLLNPKIMSGAFLMAELIYRFDLSNNK